MSGATAVVRTLLLSDLVDSTALVERLGDDHAADLFARHDRLARDLLAAWSGREVDKSDGFLLLFERPADAAGYALAYHDALRELATPLDGSLSARVGIHLGEVRVRENTAADVARGAKPLEVEGLAKPVAARVMSVAIGGQTLITAEAREALGKTRLRVQSHGHWRMRGIAEPMELFEIGDDASPWQPPQDGAKVYRVVERHDSWVPRREVRCSLPAESDAFVGREKDLDALATLVHGAARLVTLIGPAGTGKTRLARRFAWTWLGDYAGGAWYCDLSEARSVDSICGAVARAFDVPLGMDDPVVQLGHAIAGRGPCLVLLDNFEQVTEHAAATVGRWVERAAEAVFVVTSRERLALPSEHLLAVEPLPDEPAMRLFEMRARAQDAKFAVTDANRGDVAAIVQALDGLPLAIELAAARIRILPPAQLRERLKERFKVLAGARGAAQRQATLLAAIDWSWDLLSPWEKAALAQCSAFAGGFTLEAAEAVLDLSAWPEAPPAMDVVQSLLDKSLLRVQSGWGDIDEPYFGMYVSIHEYATEKLRAAGALPNGATGADAETATFDRHGRYFARLGTEEAIAAHDTHGGVARRQALAFELENLVSACQRAVARSDGPTAVATFAAAWSVLALKGPFIVGAELGRQILRIGTLRPAERGRASRSLGESLWRAGLMDEALEQYLEGLAIAREVRNRHDEGAVLGNLATLHMNQGRMEEALRHYQEALAIAREDGNRCFEGSVLVALGILHCEQGRTEEALTQYQEGLAIAREVGDRRLEGIALGNLGSLHHGLGRTEEALRHYQEALVIAREVGNRRFEGIVLGNLGNQHYDQGRMDVALRHYRQALAIHREVGNRRSEGHVLGNLGILHDHQGRAQEALQHYQEGLAIHREVGDRRHEGIVLGNMGSLHHDQDRTEEALRHYQQALVIHREVGNRRDEGVVRGDVGRLHARQGRFDDARETLAAGEALLRGVNDRIDLGRLLCDRGECERLAGDLPAAREQLQAAEALAQELALGPGSELGKEIAKLRAELDATSAPPGD